MRGLRDRRTGIALSVVLTGLLGGCGGSTQILGMASLERAAARSILRQRGIQTQVDCPDGVPRRVGFRFWCRAQLNVGSYPLLMVETNGAGEVRYENSAPLQVLQIGRVERAIALRLSGAGLEGARASCPREVIQRAGVSFTCDARVGGRQLRFAVRELDGAGRVRFSQLP